MVIIMIVLVTIVLYAMLYVAHAQMEPTEIPVPIALDLKKPVPLVTDVLLDIG